MLAPSRAWNQPLREALESVFSKALPPVLLPHMIMDLGREWPFVLAGMGMPICVIDS